MLVRNGFHHVFASRLPVANLVGRQVHQFVDPTTQSPVEGLACNAIADLGGEPLPRHIRLLNENGCRCGLQDFYQLFDATYGESVINCWPGCESYGQRG